MHFKEYIKLTESRTSPKIAKSIVDTVGKLINEQVVSFDFLNHKFGLLLGNVQSGKTGQMLGVIASAADHDFELFIILTSDNIQLQKQTFTRTLDFLDTFCVCDESDDIRYLTNALRKPTVIVLKKNIRVLETWKNLISSSKFARGRPIFIVDDEADAASLNTKVNQDDQSTINKKINEIVDLSNSSFYLQVTATPQSILLQSNNSTHKPDFVQYFHPGEGYLGGDFFYNTSEPYAERQVPYPIRFTDEDELAVLKEEENHIPEGMQNAISSFLIVAAHFEITGFRTSSNFLIHPSVSIADHEAIAGRIGETLNILLYDLRNDHNFKSILKNAWLDLYKTKPDITDFEKCYKYIHNILEQSKINIVTMNSRSNVTVDLNKGINIVIGGNTLGRGVTFPNLHTTYYCRKSKTPQADTFWQHCRAFGYDRDSGLVRVFLPPSLFKMFSELNQANNAMIEYIENHDSSDLQLIYPKNIKPTRANVIEKDRLNIIAGGVNHFPSYPTSNNLLMLDNLLASFDEKVEYHKVDIEFLKNIIKLLESEVDVDWPKDTYINCIDSLLEKDKVDPILIVRRNRDISKNTGTLLSPTDRKIGDTFNTTLVLTLYRVNGTIDRGWNGTPLWIPNIKFPKNKFFYSMDNLD
ncbi:TPA: restriction endonuclease [Legionella pneumophila subsp. pneumophila]|uniref:Z1 domain-containing protein n=1 Tax=Legionella pneumophila TaxID=446 RepID=UPI0009836E49|nr:Z1 domain-containing protein [Legionella pneumophila]OOK43011.1 hypothetical protein LPM_1265 [Legionella pneumophila subsp. pneumophila str. Mississauga]HAT9588945.1 restriction endonuclease [Legionella pneumophila subsp. pneumophila]HAU1836306.1 restriction endonuclease [Legionella pneumophila]